jgi:tetrahydromethanopterin S-methyltransferase subunit G
MPKKHSPAHIAFQATPKGFIMAISETARLEMFGGLQKSLGEAVANTLIEHLPPGGWYDIARTADIDRIENRLDRLEARFDRLEVRMDRLEDRMDKLEARIDNLEARLDDRIDKLTQKIETNTKWMIGISITYGIGILGALVTFMVASLR